MVSGCESQKKEFHEPSDHYACQTTFINVYFPCFYWTQICPVVITCIPLQHKVLSCGKVIKRYGKGGNKKLKREVILKLKREVIKYCKGRSLNIAKGGYKIL